MTVTIAGTQATAGTPVNEGILGKVVKTAKQGHSPGMTASEGTMITSRMSTVGGPPESDSRKVSNSGKASNIEQVFFLNTSSAQKNTIITYHSKFFSSLVILSFQVGIGYV